MLEIHRCPQKQDVCCGCNYYCCCSASAFSHPPTAPDSNDDGGGELMLLVTATYVSRLARLAAQVPCVIPQKHMITHEDRKTLTPRF